MTTWLLEALFYLVVSSLVVVVNRHRRHTRIVGVALFLFSLISSATFFAELPFEGRLFHEMIGATVIATLCAFMWGVGDACRPYRIAIALCLIDVGFCGALCLRGNETVAAQIMFAVGVNAVFLGLCACVAVPGVRDRYVDWIADLDRVRGLDSSAPDFDWALRNLDR